MIEMWRWQVQAYSDPASVQVHVLQEVGHCRSDFHVWHECVPEHHPLGWRSCFASCWYADFGILHVSVCDSCSLSTTCVTDGNTNQNFGENSCTHTTSTNDWCARPTAPALRAHVHTGGRLSLALPSGSRRSRSGTALTGACCACILRFCIHTDCMCEGFPKLAAAWMRLLHVQLQYSPHRVICPSLWHELHRRARRLNLRSSGDHLRGGWL